MTCWQYLDPFTSCCGQNKFLTFGKITTKLTLEMLLYWGNKNMYFMCIWYICISRYWDGTGTWNPTSWKTRTCLYSIWLLMTLRRKIHDQWPNPASDRLAHWGRDKMHAISQTTFSSAFNFNENIWIPIKIALRIVPKGRINNIPALVQIMAWRRPGDKPLSGPMMVRLPTHICITRPQWVKQMGSDLQNFIQDYQWPKQCLGKQANMVVSRGIFWDEIIRDFPIYLTKQKNCLNFVSFFHRKSQWNFQCHTTSTKPLSFILKHVEGNPTEINLTV